MKPASTSCEYPPGSPATTSQRRRHAGNGQPSRAPNADPGAYELDFSAGAASRWSWSYVIEDAIGMAGPMAETQLSATYSVAGPLAVSDNPIFANIGLALGQGAVINLKWSEEGQLQFLPQTA